MNQIKPFALNHGDVLINSLTGSILLKKEYEDVDEGKVVKYGGHYYISTNTFEVVKTDPGVKKKFRVLALGK